MQQARITIVCGHYGAGKTNLSVNLALRAAAEGKRTVIADLDIVNPYFRTADFSSLMERQEIELVAPRFANTNLDIPILPPRLGAAIDDPSTHLVIDVGGDADGAVALGSYHEKLLKQPFEMLYTVNVRRYMEPDLEAELALMAAIEESSRLKITHLVNTTNLGRETTREILQESAPYLEELSRRTGLPVLYTAAEESLCAGLQLPGLLPVKIYVRAPWEN